MLRLILFLVMILSLAACGAKPVKPVIDVKRFEDLNYPCIQVDFPDQIRYVDMDMYKTEKDLALVYKLAMPGYDVDIVKLYGLQTDWSYDNLPQLNDSTSKIYEKVDEENPKISAVITLTVVNDELFLKGTVAEFITDDRAFRVDVWRKIKRMGAFRKDTIERWRESATGSRTVANMQIIIDGIFKNMKATECQIRGNIEMNWWK